MSLILTLMGGLGLFLFGMNFMSQGLQKAAGAKLRSVLTAISKNKYIAVPKAHGDPHLKEQRRLDLIEKKAQKEAEYKSYADKLDEIDAALRLITAKYDNDRICAKELIERVYIRRNKIEDVANDIGYSKSGLYDFMDKVLKESLDPES